ncbi:protein kinase [Brevibacterium sp. 5221]|uniref:Protein kinase n=1 Tax=Brevibacterium rongguiense TaxID=2695267 RepID=A0A6N9H9D2_9MICO|nr:serine/threonine-protein kinase [Brevibacterium rongguiense]MYM20658.1 protein kinase [Brevibacterium rongguiense]
MEELGGYRLIEELGSGGMGVVHLGMDAENSPVAVKVLHPHIAHDDTARQRLAREVRTLRRIRHPRIAEVLDAELDSAQPFIVTEFVDGMTLSDDVRENGPFSEDELVHFGHALLDALSAVHAAGVIHRDLKPANVMIMDGEPMVIDFGIAQAADEVKVTATGLVMGTPGYLSPEIADGKASSEKTDWWGWAATMAFAATGRNPYGSGPLEAVLSRVALGRANLEGAPPRFVPLLRACLDPKPERRPSSSMILDALVDIESGRMPQVGGRGGRGSGIAPIPEAPTNILPREESAGAGSPAAAAAPADGAAGYGAPGPAYGSGGAGYPPGAAAAGAPDAAATRVQDAVPGARPPYSAAPGAGATGYGAAPVPAGPGTAGSGAPDPGRGAQAARAQQAGGPHGPIGYSALGIDAQQRSDAQHHGGAQHHRSAQPLDRAAGGVPAYPQPGQGPAAGGAHPYGEAAAGPRRGRGRWAVLALIALGVALTPLAPVLLVAAVYLWQLPARTAGSVVRSQQLRALRYGPQAGGGWGAAPGGFATALFTSFFCLLLPLTAAIAVTVLVRLDVVGVIPRGHSEECSLWAGAAVGALVLFVGPGAANLRRGSGAVLAGLVRGSATGGLILAVALGAIAVLAVIAVWGGASVTWWPLPTNPFTWLPSTRLF